jgi:hypothetical protein
VAILAFRKPGSDDALPGIRRSTGSIVIDNINVYAQFRKMECRAGTGYPCPDHDCVHVVETKGRSSRSSRRTRSTDVQNVWRGDRSGADFERYNRGSRNTVRMSETMRGTSASFSLPYKSSNLPEGFTR